MSKKKTILIMQNSFIELLQYYSYAELESNFGINAISFISYNKFTLSQYDIIINWAISKSDLYKPLSYLEDLKIIPAKIKNKMKLIQLLD